MGNFETAGNIALIIIGLGGVGISGIIFYLAAFPEPDNAAPQSVWVVCGIIPLVFSLFMIYFGWRGITKREGTNYYQQGFPYPQPPQYPNEQYARTPRHRKLIINNIGEYIAGNKINIDKHIEGDYNELKHVSTSENIQISDSVITRSNIGGSEKKLDYMPSKVNKKEILVRYKLILEHALKDGVISEEEAGILRIMRKKDNISINDHYMILDEIEKNKR